MLEQFGFTSHEESIYLLLNERGNLSAGKISKYSQINRRTTYDALQRLVDKGVIGTSLTNGKHVFFALHPQVFADKALALAESVKRLVPSLLLQRDQAQAQPVSVALFSGRRGIRHILDRIVQSGEYYSIGSSDSWKQHLNIEFEYFQNRKKETGVAGKTLLGSALKHSQLAAEISPQTKVKYFDEKHPSPVSIFIYESEVALFIFGKTSYVIVITGSDVVNAYNSYFESMWGE